jgi:D-aminoacyl-tRNA deacylase
VKFCIVTSQKDVVGVNVFNLLIDKFNFEITDELFDNFPIYRNKDTILLHCAEDTIHINYLDKYFNPNAYVFASRHESESKKPCLTVHATGNFEDDISYGGKKRELSIFHAVLAKKAFKKLYTSVKELGVNKQVCLEVTHHGPTSIKKPMFFIEIGSSEKDWNDKVCCELLANVIMKTIEESEIPEHGNIVIGFGGPHYAPNFLDLELNNYILGHICPKYSIKKIDEEMIKQMLEKTFPRASLALIDWKGLKSEEREFLIKKLEKMNVSYERI